MVQLIGQAVLVGRITLDDLVIVFDMINASEWAPMPVCKFTLSLKTLPWRYITTALNSV